MERVFHEFDVKGDGRISRPELAVLFESLGHAATDDELSRMMAEADADGDGDGFSSLEEFAVLNATAAGDDEEDLRLAFNVFDADGSGAISAAELARVLLPAKCLRAALLLPAPAPARAPGPKVASSADASCFCSHCMCGLSLTLTKEGTPSTSRKTELHHQAKNVSDEHRHGFTALITRYSSSSSLATTRLRHFILHPVPVAFGPLTVVADDGRHSSFVASSRKKSEEARHAGSKHACTLLYLCFCTYGDAGLCCNAKFSWNLDALLILLANLLFKCWELCAYS